MKNLKKSDSDVRENIIHGEKNENKIFTISSSKINDEGFDNIVINNNMSINNEIFKEHEENYSLNTISWLKANFFLADQRLLFGTWSGVFTGILLNLFGVVMFVRAGWMIANGGVLISLLGKHFSLTNSKTLFFLLKFYFIR